MEAREAVGLVPYAMRSSASRGRAHEEEEHGWRPAYQRDRERIIHATAFRRLEYKTQVFVNHEGDHYRTRLTHTIEVAQIARAIARVLNVNEDLVEAVALAHDIGHTPFGHSGEEALRELMKDHGGFEHNIHGLRVVDVLEDPYPGFRGLNLTWEVRESIVKHVTTYDRPQFKEFDPDLQPLLEAQIVDVSDGVAYLTHDLDDAISAGILEERVYDDVPLLRDVAADVRGKHGDLSKRRLRRLVVRALINLLVTDLCRATLARLEAKGIESVENVREAGAKVVAFSPEIDGPRGELQQYLFDHMYRHYRVARMADKAKRFMKELFHAFTENSHQLPPYYQTWAEKAGLEQCVCDYIAGMTDRYAQDEYMRLFTPYERV